MFGCLRSPTLGGTNPVENQAFSLFAAHTSACDEIVQRIMAGESGFKVSDNLTSYDVEYIENQLAKRGIHANINIE